MTDDLLTPKNLARVYAVLEAEDAAHTAEAVRAACRTHLPEALERLMSIAFTAPEPRQLRF